MATRYLVLLRGINVGGRNKVPMAALRELLESHGHTKVSTYIASGNVILSSDRSAAAIKRELEDALPKAFKLDSELIAVLVLTQAQLRAVVRDRPKGFGDQPDTYHSDAIFLMGIDAPTAMKVFDPRPGVDEVWPGKGVIYSQRLSAQRTKSRLGKIVGTPGLQVDDDPQLADDDGAARAHGGARGVAAQLVTNRSGDEPQAGCSSPTSRSACSMTSTTASGWEIIETCEASISVIFAPACSAIARRETGSMILSCRTDDGPRRDVLPGRRTGRLGEPGERRRPLRRVDHRRVLGGDVLGEALRHGARQEVGVDDLGRCAGDRDQLECAGRIGDGRAQGGPCAGERDGGLALVRDERVDVDQRP